jgi:hypothetical protein
VHAELQDVLAARGQEALSAEIKVDRGEFQKAELGFEQVLATRVSSRLTDLIRPDRSF